MVTINTSTILAVSSSTVAVIDENGFIKFKESELAKQERIKEKAKKTKSGLRAPTSKERRKVIEK